MSNSYENIRKVIIESFEELGIYIDETEEDIDINEYGIDSILYISFIVSLEEKMKMVFPDELLLFENFSSINGFAGLVKELYDEQSNHDIIT